MSATVDAQQGAWDEDLGVTFYADTSMTLPGKASPGKNCGDWFPLEFCDECANLDYQQSRCQQRGCPDCWLIWRRDRAAGMTARLAAGRHLSVWDVTEKHRCDRLGQRGHRVGECEECGQEPVQPSEEWLKKRAVHAVVSPPEGSVRSLGDVQDGFREAYSLAEERGVRGGVAIFHGFRVRTEVREVWEAERELQKTSMKLWRWVREHEQDWRELTYWSPHWHVLGLSADFEADEGDEPEQWRVRRIRSLDSFRLDEPVRRQDGAETGWEDMTGAAMYLLSHSSFESDTSKDCVRWFGELSTASFSPEDALDEGEWATIRRKAAEAADAPLPPDEGDEGGARECEDCGSSSWSHISKAGGALVDPGWTSDIGRDREKRLATAFEWYIGERKPPPGMKHPRTEEQALEALESLL